tara:strand:+ start:133 stop:438 length:306 start_codon:yes stop_codon:yes gene_type:complete
MSYEEALQQGEILQRKGLSVVYQHLNRENRKEFLRYLHSECPESVRDFPRKVGTLEFSQAVKIHIYGMRLLTKEINTSLNISLERARDFTNTINEATRRLS